ncbi:MAG: hypothetical protein K9L30_06905 [Desulfobacterales bacterium]|nr:hypothetical protein [Desulfobacterales bacterium]
MKNEKANQRQNVIFEFGILIQPYVELAQKKLPPTVDEYRIAIAKVSAGDASWRLGVKKYATFANDLFFNEEYQRLSHTAERFMFKVRDLIADQEMHKNLPLLQRTFLRILDETKNIFFDLVSEIPVSWEPEILAANTPFTSYLRIKEALSIVKKRFEYYDRYLKPDFFDLFVSKLEKAVSIKLITTKGNKDYGVKGVTAVSDLFRKEYLDYKLIKVTPDVLHDRNLRIDDNIFTLGPGADSAGMRLTNFGPTDSSQQAHAELEKVISSGTIIHESKK